MAKGPKQLEDLFHDTLKDIYFAEKKIFATLPKMAKAAHSAELRQAFEKHRQDTEGHIKRLEQVFGLIEAKPQGKTCDAIMGIVKEGEGVLEDYMDSPALDAALIGVAQAVEHYEMSRYATLKCWAEELNIKGAAKLLDATLQEERATDAALSRLAVIVVSQRAEAA